MKKIIFSLFLAVAFSLSSCDKFLDINTNPNYPADATADRLFAGGTVGMVSVLGGDMQLVGSFWSQYYTQNGATNQYWSTVRYVIRTSSFQSFWTTTYANAIKNLNLAVIRAKADNQPNIEMMSKVLIAFNFNMLTDWYGDIPFLEVLQGEAKQHPKFDDSKTVVYPGIIKMLDEAIALAPQAAKEAELGDNDMLFGGKIELWVKLAKTLKLRAYIRDFEANRVAIEALLTEGDLLTMDAGLIGKFRDEPAKSNPLYEADRRGLNTPNNLRATNTIVKIFNDNNDPRVVSVFDPEATSGAFIGLPYGIQAQTPSSRARLAATDNVYVVSAVESYFLQAEAWLRLGDKAQAKTAYDKAMLASFDRASKLFEIYTGVDNTNARLKTQVKMFVEKFTPDQVRGESFIAVGGVYAFDQSKSQDELFTQIMTQKWISSIRAQGSNAYFDVKRTGIPTLSYDKNEVPNRMLYPDATLQYNNNAPKEVPGLWVPLWWQKQ